MTVSNGINKLLKKGESENVEFKKSLAEIREIIETISAFANTKGGTIVVGVTDKGEIKGVNIGKKTIEDLVLKIANSTNPRVFPEVETIEVKSKKLIVIKVSERSDKPVFAFGIAYKRVGKNNLKMDREEILEILKKSAEINFEDREICDVSEIDKEAVKNFAENAREKRKMKTKPIAILENLGMVKENKINVAGLLCFGKSPQKYLPYAVIKIGKFVGRKIVYEKEIKGNLIEQIEKSYAEVVTLIRKKISSVKLKREEVFEYPLEAIREIIVNAVAHRDYSSKSPIYIRIFEDKLEVENPGNLLELSIEDLKKPHRSVLRNPKIAEVLYYLGYIEKWGTGTLMVIKACLENGNAEPEFETNGTFKVIIHSSLSFQINEIERNIIEYLKNKKVATRKEIEKAIKIKESTARKYLESMQKKGIIIKIGKGKNIRYKITEFYSPEN